MIPDNMITKTVQELKRFLYRSLSSVCHSGRLIVQGFVSGPDFWYNIPKLKKRKKTSTDLLNKI